MISGPGFLAILYQIIISAILFHLWDSFLVSKQINQSSASIMAYMGASSRSFPFKKGMETMNRYSSVLPPACVMSCPAAAADPPVAIRSL